MKFLFMHFFEPHITWKAKLKYLAGSVETSHFLTTLTSAVYGRPCMIQFLISDSKSLR